MVILRAGPPLFRIFVITILFLAPGVGGTASDDRAPDPRFETDGAACREHLDEGSDTTCIVHYAHIFDTLNRAALTTGRPPDDAEDIRRGNLPHAGYEPIWNLNSLTLAPLPGNADYDHDPHGPEVHYDWGLAGNLTLDPEIPIFGYWYMSTSGGALPCLTVRMTIETDLFRGEGKRLTEGEMTKTVLAAPAPDLEHTCTADRTAAVESGQVTEFAIEMPPITVPITDDDDFAVHVEWWNHAPGDPDEQDKHYLTSWRIHSGPDWAPRIVLPVERPLHAEQGRAKIDGGTAYLEALFSSPFGAYDIDPESIRLKVFDPSGDPVEATLQDPDLFYGKNHSSHVDPVRGVVIWRHAQDQLPAGTYTGVMTAQNLQGSSETSAIITIPLDDAVAESPPVGPILLLLALAALASSRRTPRPPGQRAADHRNP